MKGTILWIAYEKYFGMPLGDHVIFGTCRTTHDGYEVEKMQYLLPFPEYGESRKTITMTVTFV